MHVPVHMCHFTAKQIKLISWVFENKLPHTTTHAPHMHCGHVHTLHMHISNIKKAVVGTLYDITGAELPHEVRHTHGPCYSVLSSTHLSEKEGRSLAGCVGGAWGHQSGWPHPEFSWEDDLDESLRQRVIRLLSLKAPNMHHYHGNHTCWRWIGFPSEPGRPRRNLVLLNRIWFRLLSGLNRNSLLRQSYFKPGTLF